MEGRRQPADGLPDREYVTALETADFLSVHVRTVYNYAQTGRLTPYYITGSRAVRFLRTDVESLIADGRDKGKESQ